MFSALPFAQMNPSGMSDDRLIAFVGFTFIFLLLFWLFDRPARLATTFIRWGILVAILSVGYAMTCVPAAIQITQTLAKIGFLLVLGGLALAAFLNFPEPPDSNSKERGQ